MPDRQSEHIGTATRLPKPEPDSTPDGRFDVSRLDYDLPPDRIAQQPCTPRDSARLLAVERTSKNLADSRIQDLPHWLRSGDLLVLNNTQVLPAKFTLRRQTGGRIEGLFIREHQPGRWEVMLRGASRVSPGETLTFAGRRCESSVTARCNLGRGRWEVDVTPPEPATALLDRVGRAPLPPYIHRQPETDVRDNEDRRRYQTVFANRPGAIAAPTAGLHFSNELFVQLRQGGVQTAAVTLHVGMGTFAPVTVDSLADHPMHEEWFEMTDDAANRINACRARGGRVIAVGTTAVRVLESRADDSGAVQSGTGQTQLFIYPPYRFKVVDALLTNFHLPRSTLLALVMAFGGEELMRGAYLHAVNDGYRFYSYGDAMLVV
ncbi:MAG: tRNA preQ1(34) S-adenosylmethionine ribosyltransferase-isomerase QueA [Planctomycetes bacterium]|nr:tRNA preQ1(34) S-adenosylmethionine ribosyltransferase-isomerase QueA [Planctomycetota bacterium]